MFLRLRKRRVCSHRKSHRTAQRGLYVWAWTTMSISLIGCQPQMVDQPRVDTLQPSTIGGGQRSSVAGTIARGAPITEDATRTGTADGKPIARIPVALSDTLLSRGQQRFNIYCSPCHGPAGYGDGMVVQRGFPAPPSYYIERLIAAPDGELFRVITLGRGRMPAFGKRLVPEDRWAIVAYIRALQLGQAADLTDLPAIDQLPFASSKKND